jgi:hypothetical protein
MATMRCQARPAALHASGSSRRLLLPAKQSLQSRIGFLQAAPRRQQQQPGRRRLPALVPVAARSGGGGGGGGRGGREGGQRRSGSRPPAKLDTNKLLQQYGLPALGVLVAATAIGPLIGGLVFGVLGLSFAVAATATALSFAWLFLPLFFFPLLLASGMFKGALGPLGCVCGC